MDRRQIDYTRAVLVFMMIVLVIGMVFRVRLGVEMLDKLTRMEQLLTRNQEQDTAALPSAFSVLEESCTDCHSERRFGGLALSSKSVDELVTKMNRHPDVEFTTVQWGRIHAALVLQRCLPCHQEDAVKTFLALPHYNRQGLVDHMIHSSGSTITRSDTEEILNAALVLGSN
jgi:hypothetical protein